MAAEVPVTDILCEAMEYLSKLGSNLQTRSNNLKDKRIRKEKLRNNHAVQKAASKVLLICELSKKSLDNVETGVRKVLSLLQASQAPSNIGGNTSDSKYTTSKDKYHYFEYQSRKLRIAKKIPLKHYMSVKVLARSMPVSMQEKYPVYYDCKLKRLRRREAQKYKSELKRKRSETYSDKEQSKTIGSSDDDENSGDDIASDADQNHEPVTGDNDNQEIVCNSIVTENETPILDDNNSENTKQNKRLSSSRSGSEENVSCEPKGIVDHDYFETEFRKLSTEVLAEDSDKLECEKDLLSKSDRHDPETRSDGNNKDIIKKKKGRVRFADVYNSDSNESHERKNKGNVTTEVNLCSDEENDQDTGNEPKSKKLKLTKSDDSTEKQLVSNNDKLSDSIKEQYSDNNSLGTKSHESSQDNSGTETKPLIRCVNLSKLLKPDIVNKTSTNNICKKASPLKSKKLSDYYKVTNVKEKNYIKDEAKRKQKKRDVEYWEQKRKEVSQFKPKKLSINIERLPNFNVNFLLAHNLSKITAKDNIICKVEKEVPKNALLDDSDLDACKDKAKAKEVKESLLKDSDSECNTSKKKQHSKPESSVNKHNQEKKTNSDSIKDSLLRDSDSEKNEVADSGKENIISECLSNDVRVEIEKEASNKKKQNNDGKSGNEEDSIQSDNTPTKINQKVKSALLNDSSDENCDETPSKTNDQVKSSLLHSTSDEEVGTNDKETTTNINEKVKSSLLQDSPDKSDKNGEKTPTKTNNTVKSSVLNSPPDEDFPGFCKDDQVTPPKLNKIVKLSLFNDLSEDKPNRSEEETPTKTNEKVKSSLLNDSSDNKSEEETPTKTNQKIKSSLLNDSSEEKSGQNEDDPTTKVNEKDKGDLKESSDVKSDSSDNKREKRKTPKHKRRHSRKSREAKQQLWYSSSSESEKEKQSHKQMRRKSRISSSSSSEHVMAKELNSPNSSDNDTARRIVQVDGADEHSNSSVEKMVRSKAKPSGSSSQNSDNQDASDKDIDRLTNLNNLNKNRRRDYSANSKEDAASKKKNNRSKDTPIIGEDLLKPESSSDASDDGENEYEEDLPSVTITGLNGDSIDHMAHEDLLVESDSSASHNEKDQSENIENMDETDEEENLKLRRRKANAISSDSDGGTHRRKQEKNERTTDFEDSEDESSEPAKKSKRKKKGSDSGSDASADSNEDGKKKRRRIKSVRDSDASGSDTENEGRNKHGRKNIRKVMGKNQLEEATKKAAREEKERVARIAERQKLYNNLDFDESGKPDEVVLEKVILDFDPETKEPLIQVDRGLVKKLKPHQANGIKFMWDACFESVKRIKKDKGSGCILAHCMGLGKTLQVISLTHTLLTHCSLTGVNRVLVVCPLSTVLNWVNEYRMWLKHADSEFDVDVYELSRYKQNSERAFQLQQWLDGGGVCVLGYEMFRNLSADNNKKFKKKMLRTFQESLVDPGPDLVVCDEGHLLKNEKTSLSQSMNRVRTLRRIVLTGTPLQNNLKEYYCMVQFVKPNLLGKYNEYLNRFVNPITNGQYTDSTEHDIRVMKRRSHVLHKMLDGAVQRRDYGVLAPFLPPKHEYVLFITLSDVQVKLYQFYLENYSRRPMPGKSSGFLFPDFQSLQRIWTHPLVLKYNSERYEIMQQKKREREEEDSEGSLVDFIDDDSTPEESSTEESSDDLSDVSDDSRKKSKKKKSAKKGKGKETKASTRRGTRANPVEVDDDVPEPEDIIEVKNENPTEWWIKLVEETELDDMRNSHKLVLLFDILRQCDTIGDKLLVFSQSLYSLDLIEHFLGKVDEATQEGRIDEKLGGHVGSWAPGVDYFRLDGSTSCENRSIWCKNFNREDNPRARLFLISTRAGGLGINLVAANRVVIFDVSWNPSHDVQSIFRVYRFGQKKPCYVYRFLAMGTMEEKIYERQVTKQAISKRVIDEQQIDRHYAENDLAELYKFEARPDEPRPLPTLPKDRLFAEMLREHEAQIYKYHEHDSLLENKEEETLSEEERKAAWEDFENEKNKPPPAPFPSAWPMHNGMVPNLLAQQQQQLAYAALVSMIRKDMPNISDNQIRDMLPLIYNSNPGLMQKLGDVYKYAQTGMMNPGMMNPVMNAGGGGGGMSGTSSLQYEPPWQRQHQQQQQMRLQQILQQQNQMGAKFYAGGLGSRDPVAMALQQQRAREIMMGGAGGAPPAAPGPGAAAGRPRGRPPLHPRLPAATSPDVVNLDSD